MVVFVVMGVSHVLGTLGKVEHRGYGARSSTYSDSYEAYKDDHASVLSQRLIMTGMNLKKNN